VKRRNKLLLGVVGLAAIGLLATGCTANFATSKEKSRIAWAVEPGASSFVYEGPTEQDGSMVYNQPTESAPNIRQIVYAVIDEDYNVVNYTHSPLLTSAIKSAKSSSIGVPSFNYFVEIDKLVFEIAYKTFTENGGTINSQEDLNACLKEYGYIKYYDPDTKNTYDNYKRISNYLRNKLGPTEAATVDFEGHYLSVLNTEVNKYRSCITVYDKEIEYGTFELKLEQVKWKDAWGKGGHLIEGLIVYPVAWLIDAFALTFAGGKNAAPSTIAEQYATGVPQILSILVVTIIVRLFIFLCTFKSVLSQKKMTELQPELAKIQQKYPNANTNQAQKQRLAEEQMRLYKKNKVNPLSQLLVLVVQFPIFIGVWGAMTGSAVLATGKFLDLNLSDSIWAVLKLGPKGHGGWWTALILILLMSAGQFFSMKVPQWIQKAKTNKIARLGKNPAQQQQNRTANMMSYIMLGMIIVMGFTLPAAMGVYWFVGAIVSLIQTTFTSVIFAGDKKKK